MPTPGNTDSRGEIRQMAQGTMFDVRQAVLSNTTFGPREVEQLVTAIAQDHSSYRPLREAVDELQNQEDRSPATSVRLGVCYYLLGRYGRAIETLKAGDGGALAQFYLGKSQYAQQEYAEAIKAFEAA